MSYLQVCLVPNECRNVGMIIFFIQLPIECVCLSISYGAEEADRRCLRCIGFPSLISRPFMHTLLGLFYQSPFST